MSGEFNFNEFDLNQLCHSGENKTQGNYNYHWHVNGISQLLKIVSHINNQYKCATFDFPNTLWFRGHSKERYVLLPSLIRSYFDKEQQGSLPQYQRILLEKFLARSRLVAELPVGRQIKRDNEQIEDIADMQHYGVPTSLLDWSEDIGTALYMATEKDPEGNSAIYILHPYFYNVVRNTIILAYSDIRPDDDLGRLNRETAKANIGGILPNFSAHFNMAAMQYTNYITGPEFFYSLRDSVHCRHSNPLSCIKGDAPLLPLAIRIPRNNARILSQNGTFLAFNLCEMPLENYDNKYHGFHHVELELVQRFYMTSEELKTHIKTHMDINDPRCRAMLSGLPFLHKIVIETAAYYDIKFFASILGKRMDTVYPELYHIGKQIASEKENA